MFEGGIVNGFIKYWTIDLIWKNGRINWIGIAMVIGCIIYIAWRLHNSSKNIGGGSGKRGASYGYSQ